MMVFGEQRHGEGDFHRCAFTPTVIKADVEAAGFTLRFPPQLLWTHSQETIQIIAIKPVRPAPA
jgi:hypothetical protein